MSLMMLILTLLLHMLIMPVCARAHRCVCAVPTPCGSPVVYNYTLSFECFFLDSVSWFNFSSSHISSFPVSLHLPSCSPSPPLLLLSCLTQSIPLVLIPPLPPSFLPLLLSTRHHQGCCSVLRSRLPTLQWGITGGDISPPHSAPSYSGCSLCGTRMLVRGGSRTHTHTHTYIF